MKILHAIPSLDIGGAEKIVANLSNALADKNHQVSVLLYKPVNKNGFLVSDKVSVKVVTSKLPVKFNLVSLIRIFLFLKKEKFDVIHTHLTINNTLIRFLAILANTPVVIGHEHGGFLVRNKVARYFLSSLEKHITYNLFISEHDKAYYSNYDKSKLSNKGLVINNPLMINSKPLAYKFNSDIKIIGMLGRIIDVKGHLWAVKSMLPFLKENKCKVVIVGDGDEGIKSELTLFAAQNNFVLEITGFTQNIESYLSTFDVLIHPSFTEGFGLAIIEAMAFGLPVIASNVGGIPNIIQHGFNGLLFEAGNENDLLQKLKELNTDRSLKENLSRNGYNAVIEKFSFEKYVSTIEDLYKKSLYKIQKA